MKLPFLFQPGRYDKCDQHQTYIACHCGDIPTSHKFWVFTWAHKFTVQSVDGGKGKWLVNNLTTMPTKHKNKKYIFFCRFSTTKPKYTAGMMLLGRSNLDIPAYTPVIHGDANCQVEKSQKTVCRQKSVLFTQLYRIKKIVSIQFLSPAHEPALKNNPVQLFCLKTK